MQDDSMVKGKEGELMQLHDEIGILLDKLQIANKALLIQCGQCPDCGARLINADKVWKEKCPKCNNVYDVLEGKLV